MSAEPKTGDAKTHRWGGRYHHLCDLAEGGMATVHLTLMHAPGGFSKLVVVKQIRAELLEEPGLRDLFLHEARLAARFNHPNVVQTYEVGCLDSQPFLAMEYLEGISYSKLLRPSCKTPLSLHLRVLCDVLAGLHYAHELKDFDGTKLDVVHRDVSPQNVLVTYTGTAKIVDFGIAKGALADGHEKDEKFMGKVAYAAPEQICGGPVDHRADIFCVGVMLWEALAGRRLWGSADESLLERVLFAPIPDVREAKADVPLSLAKIVARALAREPSERFPTAASMAEEIESFAVSCRLATTSRAVGAFTSSRFAEGRIRISSLVESRSRALRDEGAGALSFDRPEEKLVEKSTATVSQGPTSPPTAGAGVAWTTSERPRASRKWPVWVSLGVASLVACGALSTRALHTQPDAPAEPKNAAAVTWAERPEPRALSAPQKAPEAPSATVQIEVNVTPSNATIRLDGEIVGTGHYKGSRPRDTHSHDFKIEAPGYVTQMESSALGSDAHLSFDLAKVARAAKPRPSQARPALDLDNPYR